MLRADRLSDVDFGTCDAVPGLSRGLTSCRELRNATSQHPRPLAPTERPGRLIYVKGRSTGKSTV